MNTRMTTPELVEQVENSELVYMLDRMKAIQEREHNPMGIALQRFGPAVAIASREMPWPQFNTVKGFGFAGTAQLDEVLKWYKEQGGSPQFEIVPSRIDGETLLALAKQGFYQSGFHASMAGSIAEQAGMRSEEGHTGVVVRRLGEHEVDLYAELHALGSGLPIAGKNHIADNNRMLFNREGWQFYAAEIDHIAVGVGVMHIHEHIASLTFAATLPEYRKRGVQAALIAARLRAAAQAGCILMVGQAGYCSSSHRNMQRAGMSLCYTRSTWSRLPSM
ncbi:GNAT family N-acetyltransferase [Paenibacillus sp. FSL H8-0537]|uniref:GNAT family N-acetyltransferase n=1 Tax=Paenibacillus sp. FSL H8-0537 TaxID=2921399 RepID=UPI003101170F